MSDLAALPAPASPLRLLAERAAIAPYDPWLFHGWGWEWRWRSWGEVADQVARGAAVVRRAPLIDPAAAIACDRRQDPDAVAALLAVQAAARTAVLVGGGAERATFADACRSGAGAFAEVAADPEDEGGWEEAPAAADAPAVLKLRLPACRPHLDHRPLQPLTPDDGATDEALARQAADLTRRLAAAVGGELRGPGPSRRPLVCAGPDLPPAVHRLVLAWTLQTGAAWALDPHPASFLETILWTRPSLVLAAPADLARLAAALHTRPHRRASRLAAVVAVGPGADRAAWSELGVPCVEISSTPTQD